MHESWQTNNNEIKEDVERFEQMENGEKEFYFDVHSIENIFDFYADEDQLEKAERVLQLGFKQHPNSTSLLSKKAVMLMEKGSDQEAIKLMEGLINLEQSNPEFNLNLGWVYLRNGYLNSSIESFNKTLEVAFDEREDYLLDIVLYLNQSEYFKATINYLEIECVRYPKNENLLFELAFAYDKEGNIDKGIGTYKKLLEVNPFSENGWYNLGILYIKNQELDLANSCYDYALALNPSHAEALFNKGNSLVHLGQFQEAIDCYFDYVSYGYDPLLAYHYLADSLEQLGHIEHSLRFYRLTIETDSGYVPGWLGYISLLINNDISEEALEASQKALEAFSEYSEFYYLRARALLLIDDVKGARKAFELSFKLDPDNLRNAFELYQIKLASSSRNKGLTIWEKWLKKHPDSPAVNYLGAAILIQEAKDLKKGAIHLENAVKSDPDSYDLFIELYPGIEKIIKKSKKLNQIIIRYFDYEL